MATTLGAPRERSGTTVHRPALLGINDARFCARTDRAKSNGGGVVAINSFAWRRFARIFAQRRRHANDDNVVASGAGGESSPTAPMASADSFSAVAGQRSPRSI